MASLFLFSYIGAMKIKILKEISYLDKGRFKVGDIVNINRIHAEEMITSGHAIQYIDQKEFKGEKATKEWKSLADLTK